MVENEKEKEIENDSFPSRVATTDPARHRRPVKSDRRAVIVPDQIITSNEIRSL